MCTVLKYTTQVLIVNRYVLFLMYYFQYIIMLGDNRIIVILSNKVNMKVLVQYLQAEPITDMLVIATESSLIL